MKPYIFFCIAVLVFFSCRKSSPAPVEPASMPPRVKQFVSEGETANFTYDDKRHIALKTFNSGAHYEYTYTDTGIVETFHNIQGGVAGIKYYHLGSNGLATGYTSTTDPGVHYAFAYNSDRQLAQSCTIDDGGDTIVKSIYYYTNRNLDSVVNWYGSSFTTGYFDAYYTDKSNSLGNENLGQAWLGANTKNPIRTSRPGEYDSHGDLLIYSYQDNFDAQGRIINYTLDYGGGGTTLATIAYY